MSWRSVGPALGGLILLAAWIGWLRQPAFTTPVWNVDEGITAAIADEILAGGLPYRDATDLRAPLTYYLYAAVFAVAGPNNMAAIKVAHTALVIATAIAVYLLGARLGGRIWGAWAAWLYAVISCTLLPPLDLFALHTEWPLALGTAVGAWLFWQSDGDRRWLFAAGLCYGLAALSKQPAVLDLAAPLGCLIVGAVLDSGRRRRLAGDAAVLGAGVAVFPLIALGYFAAHGAARDFIFYTWSYNTRFYVPEVPLADRWPSAAVPWRLLDALPPSLAWICALGAGGAVWTLGRRRDAQSAARAFPSLWFIAALAATTLSGRGFEHYSIQLMAPAALLAGQVLHFLTRVAIEGWRGTIARRILSGGLTLALAALAIAQARHAWQYRRHVQPHLDPCTQPAEFLRHLTARTDRVQVWGMYSDLLTLANRLPASRHVHSVFVCGLIPWTNVDRDTSYAAVPGAVEELIADMERRQARVFVDASGSLNRRFTSQPPEKIPLLSRYLAENFAEIDPQRFSADGFKFHLRIRRNPAMSLPGAPGTGSASIIVEEIWDDLSEWLAVTVRATGFDGELTGLGLFTGADAARWIEFPATDAARASFRVPRSGHRPEQIRPFALDRAGTRRYGSAPIENPPPTTQWDFPEPAGILPLREVRSPFRPARLDEPIGPVWAMHAPAAARFELPQGAARLEVGFGMFPSTYDPSSGMTDGVEFSVALKRGGEPALVLFRKLLRPVADVTHRQLQKATIPLPALLPGDELILLQHPGPARDMRHDSAYWTPPRVVLSAPRG